jgi:hypothetical protein
MHQQAMIGVDPESELLILAPALKSHSLQHTCRSCKSNHVIDRRLLGQAKSGREQVLDDMSRWWRYTF